MKQHINFKSLLTLAIISLLGISFIACNDKDEIEDEQLIAVKSLKSRPMMNTLYYNLLQIYIRMVKKRN